MRAKIMFLLVAFFGVSADLGAQQSVPLSLKQAVDAAVDRSGNTRIQLANELVQQSKAKAAQSRAALLPDISASIGQQSQTRSLIASGFRPEDLPAGITFPSVVGPFNTFDARATATQRLLDLSSIRSYKAARTETQAVKYDSEAAKEDTAALVARTYLNGVRMQAVVETAQSNVALSEALLRLANSQKQAGTGTGIEVTRAEVQLANDRQALLVARTDYRQAQLQLLRTLGLGLDSPIELTDRLAYTPEETISVQQALNTARESLASLKAQKEHEESARLNHSAVSMERLPSVYAFADYGAIGLKASNMSPTRTVGISVKLPVFDGGRRDARRAESLSTFKQERIRTADLNDEIELRVRMALDAVRSADEQVRTAEHGLALSANELEQAERRYRAGVTNSVEVTDAQTRLQRARANQISAVFNHAVARIDLAAAMGTIQPLINNWR